jgi:uncharacterized lipoprotein
MNRTACLVLATLLAGCVSERTARERAQRAHQEGVQRGAAATQARLQQPPTVTVLGDVRHHRVPWSEGLTLAQALVAAEHLRRRPPRAIVLRRGNETLRLAPELLLQGVTDPQLEPGDIIELHP